MGRRRRGEGRTANGETRTDYCRCGGGRSYRSSGSCGSHCLSETVKGCCMSASHRLSGVKHVRLSTTAVSISLTGSCFSSESAPRPFQYGIRRRGGTILGAALPLTKRQVQADIRSHLIRRPARDIIPPLGGTRVSSYRI